MMDFVKSMASTPARKRKCDFDEPASKTPKMDRPAPRKSALAAELAIGIVRKCPMPFAQDENARERRMVELRAELADLERQGAPVEKPIRSVCSAASSTASECAKVQVRELRKDELKVRKETCNLVHRLVCYEDDMFRKYAADYKRVFVKDDSYRVIAAFNEQNEVVGGCAYVELRRGLYIEFLATKPDSHAGKPLMEYLRQQVIHDPQRGFISLNCQPALHEDPSTLHTFAWYYNRGFTPLDSEHTLSLVSGVMAPGATKMMTKSQFYSRFKVPQPSEGTISLIWLQGPQFGRHSTGKR